MMPMTRRRGWRCWTRCGDLNSDLKVPTPREYGIDEQRFMSLLPLMAQQALGSGSPANNPRVPTEEEIVSLYRDVYAC